jgi:hypothetical protein
MVPCLDDDGEREWLIIKVPKKMKNKSFMVDYCDGHAEDEFKWLYTVYFSSSIFSCYRILLLYYSTTLL